MVDALDELLSKSRQRGELDPSWRRRVQAKPLELVLFSRQLALMMNTGVHITDCIATLTAQAQDPEMAEVFWTVGQTIEEGYPLSRAVRRFPSVFPPIYRGLVAVGEATGALALCLDLLADWLEKEYRVRQKTQAALVYPMFVVGFSMLVSLWLFTRVLPPFFQVLHSFGAKLPWLTRLVEFLLTALASPWSWLFLLIVGGLAFSWLTSKMEQKESRLHVWRQAHRLPGIGSYLVFLANSRLAVAAATMLSAGQSSLRTWQMAFEAAGNPLYQEQIPNLIYHVEQGGRVSKFLDANPALFCAVLRHLTQAGEEVGQLARFLRQSSRLLDMEVEQRTEMATALLEPLLLSFVSAAVGIVLIAIFLPLYGHLNSLG